MAIYKVINSKGLNSKQSMYNCLQYVLRRDKTDPEHCAVLGEYPYPYVTPKKAYVAFLDTKRDFNKKSGRQYMHSVISFHKDEDITPDDAMSFGLQFADEIYSGFQTVVAVHSDKDHIHVHFVTNTVSYIDGSKYHQTKKEMQRHKEYCNRLCVDYGLTVAEKGKHFDGTDIEAGNISSWDKNTYHLLADGSKPSYLADCGLAVLKAMKKSRDKTTFISEMQKQGWETEWSDGKKHIVFKNADGRKVRGSNLLKTFNINATKEGLTDEFDRKAKLARDRADRNRGREQRRKRGR